MKFSTRATYGLKALLVLANQYGGRAVSVSQIAREEGISAPYLEQILFRLKKKQWIRSLRGPAGGYVLAKRPAEIKVGPVLQDLEGRWYPMPVLPTSPVRNSENIPSRAAALFWERLARQYSSFLDTLSLKSLIDEARSTEPSKSRRKPTSFHI